VGGEIVGSVLVNRDQPPDADDERRFHDSIIQATPVLTNLRNLALAEMQASTDSLTGLPNKRSVQVEVTRMVAQANRAVTPLAALALDIDHFKRVNDTYGHGRGDEVLAAVGGILQAVLRTSDSVGRTGGEEFLVLLPSTDLDGALAVAENIREGFAGIRVLEVDEPITVSIGIAVLPRHATDAEGLQRSADRALYLAKANGRDRIELAPENQDVGERAYALPRERPAKEPSSVSDRLTSLNRF
jgi:diguanylate cyclase (GGDEF)-like protein